MARLKERFVFYNIVYKNKMKNVEYLVAPLYNALLTINVYQNKKTIYFHILFLISKSEKRSRFLSILWTS